YEDPGMMTAFRACVGGVAIGCLLWTVTGCASDGTRGTVMSVQAADIVRLSGQWHGTFTAPSGRRFPADLQIYSNGTYVSSAEAYSSRGVVRVKDDKLMLIPEASTGPSVPIREATATLTMRADGLAVLSGFGGAPTGVYSFELQRAAPVPR